MGKLLGIFLLLTGIISLIVVTMPFLVMLGYYVLIFPGVILTAIPNIFVVLAVFSTFWAMCRPLANSYIATAIALPITAGIFWFAPQQSIQASSERFAAATADADITPETPIQLAGDVYVSAPRLDLQPLPKGTVPTPEERDKWPWVCDALCAAVLATPGVTSVTVDAIGEASAPGPLSPHARTFRLTRGEQCREGTIRPNYPDSLKIIRQHEQDSVWPRPYSLEAEWNLRLSGGECIVMDPPRETFDLVLAKASFHLFVDKKPVLGTDPQWSLAPWPVNVTKLSLTDRTGRVLLRRTYALTRVLFQPLRMAPSGDSFRFGWARQELGSTHYDPWRTDSVIQEHTNLYVGGSLESLNRAVRQRIQAMVDTPDLPPNDPGFELLDQWFNGFDRRDASLDADDRALLMRVLSDRRFTQFRNLSAPIKALGDDVTLLRPIVGRRIVSEPPSEWTWSLDYAYDRMPAGVLAVSTDDEKIILADPDRRLKTPALIERQVDKGKAAIPLLLDILRSHAMRYRERAGKLDNNDITAIGAVSRALCQLGPDAAEALPALDDIQRTSGLSFPNGYGFDWRFMLARLGRSVETIDKPKDLTISDKRYQSQLRQRLAAFDPMSSCSSSW